MSPRCIYLHFVCPGSTDVAVPFSRLADIIEVSKKEMDDLGLFASILGHIGDGNFHESIIYNRQDPAERDKVEACVKNMVKRALEMEGTCTGEHSIGWGKKESLVWEVGHDTLGVMVSLVFGCGGASLTTGWLTQLQKAIKAALDPKWIMLVFPFSSQTDMVSNIRKANRNLLRNPGKIFDRQG